MSKGKKRSGARPGRPQPLRGTKGKRKGARLWYVGGFFFSSRRRHTSCGRDWSSDVCSSDLVGSRAGQGDLAAPRWQTRHLVECAGHLMFAREEYPLRLSDIAAVKVGAVSGLDAVYADPEHGNRDFVCSETARTGRTRRMIWCEPGEPPPAALLPQRERLLARRIRRFDESNWWHWGRGYHRSGRPRVYVNSRTRGTRPFFLHPCLAYDGSVLALFPHAPDVDVAALAAALNEVDWAALGFVCDGRYLFTQRSLENAPLPAGFARFLPKG